MLNCCLEETNKSTKEDLRPMHPLLRVIEPPLQPSEPTKVKEEIKKKATGNCSENATREAGLEGFVSNRFIPLYLNKISYS